MHKLHKHALELERSGGRRGRAEVEGVRGSQRWAGKGKGGHTMTLPQYKYTTELMNETNQEHVFQQLLDQLVMLKLGELLGTSYDLS